MLPMQHATAAPYVIDLKTAHNNFDLLCESMNWDMVIVSAQDDFLSEYTAASNNQRFALSRFSGSTGDGIYLAPRLRKQLNVQHAFVLFVDGRYHLQADVECPVGGPVAVVKLVMGQGIEDAILKWIEDTSKQIALNTAARLHIAFDAARTSYQRAAKVKTLSASMGAAAVGVIGDDMTKALQLPGWRIERAIETVPWAATGRDVYENYFAIHNTLAANSCFVTCTADDAAWLTNTRGYHTPNASSILAYTIGYQNHLIVYLPASSAQCPVLLAAMETRNNKTLSIKVVRNNLPELSNCLASLGVASQIVFNERTMNAALPQMLQQIWPQATLKSDCNILEHLRARKTPQELNSFRNAFLASSAAIAATLRWAKETVAKGTDSISEWDLAQRIGAEYGIRGATEQSFRPIAGTAEMGAVIHYGTPSPNRPLMPGDITLLDSGAYYEAGLATDCTRVIYCNAGQPAAPWQREIYTVTLKACIAGMTAQFPTSELGSQLDAVVRGVTEKYGHSFAHGTGHGVGIHVHESGVGISTRASSIMPEHAVCSVEPGIYLAGKGGVRLENVVIVQKHPSKPDTLQFENLAFVGYDWDLIDISLLTDTEKSYLKAFEAQCASLGNQINACPL